MQKNYQLPDIRVVGLMPGGLICLSGAYGDTVGDGGEAGGKILGTDIIEGGEF